MPQYTYRARDAQGKPRRGVEEAQGAEALTAELRRRGWLVLRVEAAEPVRSPWSLARLNPMGWLPPRAFDIEIGLRQLSAMLRSGLTLLAALKTVAEQSRRARAAELWRDVAERIERGGTLSGAMAAQGRQFSAYVVQLARVGEESGELDPLLEQAAEHLESSRTLRMMVVNAFSYPVIVVVLAIGVSAFMLLGVIPKLQRFLADTGKSLPPMTQALLDLSAWLTQHLPTLGIGIVAAAAGLLLVNHWPPGRRMLHKFWLRMPITGTVSRLAETSVFARGMGILLESGVTLLDSLRTVEGLIRNRIVAERVAAARLAVTRGNSLAEALSTGREFLPMLPRMVAVGESTGMLGRTLADVARFHEAQLVAAIRRFGLVVEPAMILVVGGIVGFVYVAFFVALFSLAGGVR